LTEIRAFIAIELPNELRLKLARLVSELRKSGPPGVKWVNPDGIHLTLKFLGGVPAEKLPRITQAIESSTNGTAPIPLRTEGLGAFPNTRRPQVVWVGVSGDMTRLTALQKRIDSNLTPLGFTPEARPFTAHLTLARMREQVTPEEREKLGRLLVASHFEASAFIVEGVSLMRSELRKEGAVYTRLSLSQLASERTGRGVT
jgi:2'-5' RNA ligase